MSTTNLQEYKKEKNREFWEGLLAEQEEFDSIDLMAAFRGMDGSPGEENPLIRRYNQTQYERFEPFWEEIVEDVARRREQKKNEPYYPDYVPKKKKAPAK